MIMQKKIGAKNWITFILAGLVGQLAWAIENMYLNSYAFYCGKDYIYISIMTAASAAAATITTLLIGALSDRLGKRKAFITFGYIIWGISIVAFSLLDPTKSFNIVGGSALTAGVMIVIFDCIMTFFGSTANDACFNAYVTDNTSEDNRGKVESILSILPMVAMIAITVIQGLIVKDNKGWDIFFIVFGALTSLIGVILLFVMPKDNIKANKNEPYFKNIFYGFRPSVIKANKKLYITLIAFAIFNIAIQTFFPYLIVYIQNILHFVDLDFTLIFGIVLVVACILTVVVGLFMDKIGKNKLIIPALIVASLGGVLFFFAKDMWFVILAGIVLISGYLIVTAVIGAKIRDYTPKEEVGLFQGIRMVFAVLIPMVTGPFIGEAFFLINKSTYVNEYNQVVLEPNAYMFLGTAGILLLAIIPIIFLFKQEKLDNGLTHEK